MARAEDSEIRRTKTPKGYVPFKSVGLVSPEESGSSLGILDFDLYASPELRERGVHAPKPREDRHATLIRLAACLVPSRGEERPVDPSVDDILALAKDIGPLFGTSSREPARDWAFAAIPALVAARIQEFLNGGSIGQVNAMACRPGSLSLITKELLEEEGGSFAFRRFTFNMAVTGQYRRLFSRAAFPIFRRHEADSRFYYTCVNDLATEDADCHVISFTVLEFDRELGPDDYAWLLAMLDFGETDEGAAAAEALRLYESPYRTAGLNPNAPYRSTVVRGLDESDREALVALEQAIEAVHLLSVRIDPSQADGDTGFLAFDSFLAWLWYDYVNKSSTVKIGYCAECGRAFSLAGHRGVERKFCSEACKTASKNERSRKMAERIRGEFLGGSSIDRIRKDLDDARTAKQIRDTLSQWTELKHLLDEDIAENGFDKSPLFRRCIEEELNMRKLLSSKRERELVDFMAGRRGRA